MAAVPTGEDTTTPTFVTTFLGGRDYKSADVLDLTPGQMAESIDLMVDLTISSRSKVTGTVSNACLSPERCHATVMLFSRNGLITPVDQRVTDKNGTFEFDNIPDGDYLIASWPPAVDWPLTNEFPTGIQKAVITPVSTLRGEVIELTLVPTVTKTAHMSARKASDGCQTPDRLYLRSDDGWPSLWMGAATSSNQVSWGQLPSGSYQVIVPNNPNACELVSIRDGTRDSHVDQPVRLGGDSSVLELLFSPARGEVSGVVTAGAGSLIQGYVLLLGSGHSSIRRVIQVDKGHFSFTNVPAGSYYLAAFENLHSAAANLSSNTSADAYGITIDSAHERVDNLVLTLH